MALVNGRSTFMTLEVSLSTRGLANIPGQSELNDFVFIVEGSRY
jgi:hypothetical protein